MKILAAFAVIIMVISIAVWRSLKWLFDDDIHAEWTTRWWD